MEPDLDYLRSIATAVLEEHEHGQVLAWLVGVIVQDGHIERIARGERDVVVLLPDRLVFVRPDPFWMSAYQRNQVSDISYATDHAEFAVTDGEAGDKVGFWVNTAYTPVEEFQQAAQAWLVTEESSSGGCGVVAFGLAVVVGVLALLYAFGPADWGPVDSRLNARSTCGEFLRAGDDRQLDLLRRLFQEAGRPADAEKPAVLTQSRRRCEENGSVTLDSLVTGR